jgi:hypothetical protein
MEVIGDSYESNRATDGFFYKEVVTGLAALFLGEDGDPRDPLANPLLPSSRIWRHCTSRPAATRARRGERWRAGALEGWRLEGYSSDAPGMP